MIEFLSVPKANLLKKQPQDIQYKEFTVLLERFKQVQILQKLGMELTGSVLNEKEIMKTVRKCLQEAFGFSSVRFYAYDQERNLIKSVFSFGLRPTRFNTWKNPTDEKEYVIKRAQGLIPIKHGDKKDFLYIEDRTKAPYVNRKMFKQDVSFYGSPSQIKENIYYVLFSKQKEIIGLIMINNWRTGKPLFDKNQIEAIETLNIFINHTALTLENYSIYNRLLETQKELITLEKNKVLAETAFTLSHEIRNPLHAISGFTQIMKKHNYSNKKQKVFFNQIIEASNRINQVVTKFTNFSSILSSPPKFSFNRINKIIKKSIDKEQKALTNKNLFLSLENTSKTYLDTQKLIKAFQEIIRNACKSMENSENKTLEITSRIIKKENLVKITFCDHGRGIEKKYLDRIFDPLFTMTDYKKSETPGLGLPMAKIVVENYHHGKIEIKSRKNKGTKVMVSLPLIAKVSKRTQELFVRVLPNL